MTDTRVPVVILGATGYVAGEALRLLAGHPGLRLLAAISRSKAGSPLGSVFPHLVSAYVEDVFQDWEFLKDALEGEGPLVILAALPHGESAVRLDEILSRAETLARDVKLVDLSADYRHRDPEVYARWYGAPHPAPARLATFTCGLPDLCEGVPAGPVAHPGCFTTAVTLACRPLVARGLVVELEFGVSAVTGSTGSGREPKAGTHHPERHGGYKAYNPLVHRHRPEMETLVGDGTKIWFVPHSGPFARGIHATIHVTLGPGVSTEDVLDAYRAHYAGSPFVTASTNPPSLKDVVGTNRCHLGVATEGRHGVVFSVIDNLTKGAAGGALQWVNRLLGFPDAMGLCVPGLGWN